MKYLFAHSRTPTMIEFQPNAFFFCNNRISSNPIQSNPRVVETRCILASGLQLDDFRAARSILEEDQDRLGVTPLVLLTPEIADQRVGDVLTDAAEISSRQEEEEEDALGESLTSPVILISGFTNTELRDFASRFRSATGVRAAFAKAVPNAMVKAAAAVCGEIAQDHADAMAGRLHD